MRQWPPYPVIYEINTWVWLAELGQRHQRPVTLADVPAAEWDALAALRADAVWLMGVWERSPEGRRLALDNEGLLAAFREALPDVTAEDIVGSPYCVRRYVVDEGLGGPEGLAAARGQLVRRGVRLILDLVPNHVAPDHPWVREHPDYLLQGSPEELAREPEAFFQAGDKVIARGRDPYFPPWPDVVQLNAFSPGLRRAMIETISSLARQSDGLRCDMAMLLVNRIFAQTWGERAGEPPAREFWEEVTSAVRERYPGFRLLAEAYWDMEWELQQQGFDYCYDKRLYDRLVHASLGHASPLNEGAEAVRLHLLADLSYQRKLVRFIENHDEPRAAATFAPQPERAAALSVATLPGAKLFHEGQFEGRRVRLPVFLRRRPNEPPDPDLEAFYRNLLSATAEPVFREGEWRLCECVGWPDNPTWRNLVAWCWRHDDERRLVAVNLSGQQSQGRLFLPWADLAGRTSRLTDLFGAESYERDGSDMLEQGLFVDLDAWGAHLFRVT